jgi:hypothetical protein
MMKIAGIVVLLSVLLSGCGLAVAQIGHPAVNADAAIVQDLQKRVEAYVQLRKSIESNLPKLKATPSPEKISHHENELRHAVREARRNARPGEIFTPEISAEIRRLIAIAMHPGGAQVRQSLRSAEPVQLHLDINEKYPEGVPLQTTPPSLLENLPALPMEIEYRITGQDLVLLDAKANLIIDIIRGVFS